MSQGLRRSRLPLALAAALAVSACSGDVNPVRDAAVAVGVGMRPGPAPDFIATSRPADLDYVPVGTTAAPRPTPGKTQAEIKAMEAEMDRVRSANESAGRATTAAGATPPPQPPVVPAVE